MKQKKSAVVNTLDLDELFEPVKIAILLGAEIPALEGSKFFEVNWVDSESDTNYHFGAWSTREAAEMAFAQYIMDQCDSYLGQLPWDEYDPKEKALVIEDAENSWAEYFKHYSIQDLITTFHGYLTNDMYAITERTILYAPKSVLDEFVI